MKYAERINYASFNDNKEQIESDWDVAFGDRKIELVFIGQNLEKEKITKELENCILTENEIRDWKKQLFPKQDQWPIAV